ncbi:uncharacterized protein NPIL_98051 [Nephila pilipes]|uniref:Uncharacterized protein n=1 Tax=Nephila pilipes TaxID=299642 RepID=A0A8X6QE49_NEPPI|nr:uncharacterized protein NPIL_98051 [Nephila pilipes]
MDCDPSDDDGDLFFLMSKDHVTVIPMSQLCRAQDDDQEHDMTNEPSCSYDPANEMVRLRYRRKSLPGYPTDDALIYCVLQRLPMKDFAAEVRASMDVDQFLNQAVLLLDVQDTSVEGIIDKMLHKLSRILNRLFHPITFEETTSYIFLSIQRYQGDTFCFGNIS